MGRMIIRMSGKALGKILKAYTVSTEDEFPEDLEILYPIWTIGAQQSGEFEFVAQSEKWNEVPEGRQIPAIRLEIF